MSVIRIERNIPLPAARSWPKKRNQLLLGTLQSLAIGDSFILPVLPGWHISSVRTTAKQFCIKLATRTVKVDGIDRLRVWRTK